MKRLLLLTPLWAGLVAADDARFYTERPLDFSLYFSQHASDLDYGDRTVDSSVDRIGVAWRERYGERLQLGLFGGYAFLTQDDNAVTAGRELDGYHAGVSLDLDLLAAGRTTLFFSAAWLYQRAEDDDGAQEVVISWNEPSARLGARAEVGGGLRAYGGMRYGTLDGQQRLSGALNETREIGQTDRSGAFAGLELNLEGDGYVGLAAETGVARAVSLYFARRF